MLHNWLTVAALALSLVLSVTAFSQDKETEKNPDRERLKADEDLLRQGGIATDGPALIEFFRARTPGEKALEGIEKLIRDLGSDIFRIRQNASEELIRIGPQALGPLRPLISNPDPEIANRARATLAFLEKSVRPELMSAAVRVLADRKPQGGMKVLLDHLPAAADSSLIEEIHSAFCVLGFQGGKANELLRKAIEDRHPRRRAAAADALIRAGKDDERAITRPLLKDPDPGVRGCVALALVERKDREAVEPMIAVLAEAPPEQLWRIEQILFSLAGDDAPKVSPGSTPTEKREYRAAWQKWWSENGAKINLARLDQVGRLLGLTLVVQMDTRRAVGGRVLQGRVYEIGPDGKTRWEIDNLNYPVDAQVVGPDRVLVAEYRSRQITERNFKGEIVWKHAIDSYAIGAERLANGNTLIMQRNGVTEVTRAGEQVLRVNSPSGYLLGARRLKNGETVLLDSSGICTRVDGKGKELKRFRIGVALSSVIGSHFDALPNGNLLVPLYTQSKVVEVDGEGKIVWQIASERPTAVSRLPNGNTLIASRYGNKVTEVDRAGKTVWTHASTTGTVLHARRR